MKAKLEASEMKFPPRRQGSHYVDEKTEGYYFHQTGRPDGPPPVGDSNTHETDEGATKEFLYRLLDHDLDGLEVESASPQEMELIEEKRSAKWLQTGSCSICGKDLTGKSSIMLKCPSGGDFDRHQVCFDCAATGTDWESYHGSPDESIGREASLRTPYRLF